MLHERLQSKQKLYNWDALEFGAFRLESVAIALKTQSPDTPLPRHGFQSTR